MYQKKYLPLRCSITTCDTLCMSENERAEFFQIHSKTCFALNFFSPILSSSAISCSSDKFRIFSFVSCILRCKGYVYHLWLPRNQMKQRAFKYLIIGMKVALQLFSGLLSFLVLYLLIAMLGIIIPFFGR